MSAVCAVCGGVTVIVGLADFEDPVAAVRCHVCGLVWHLADECWIAVQEHHCIARFHRGGGCLATCAAPVPRPVVAGASPVKGRSV